MQKAVIMLAFAVGILVPTVEAKCSSAGHGCATASCSTAASCSEAGSCTASGTCTKKKAAVKPTKAAAKPKSTRKIGR